MELQYNYNINNNNNDPNINNNNEMESNARLTPFDIANVAHAKLSPATRSSSSPLPMNSAIATENQINFDENNNVALVNGINSIADQNANDQHDEPNHQIINNNVIETNSTIDAKLDAILNDGDTQHAHQLAGHQPTNPPPESSPSSSLSTITSTLNTSNSQLAPSTSSRLLGDRKRSSASSRGHPSDHLRGHRKSKVFVRRFKKLDQSVLSSTPAPDVKIGQRVAYKEYYGNEFGTIRWIGKFS